MRATRKPGKHYGATRTSSRSSPVSASASTSTSASSSSGANTSANPSTTSGAYFNFFAPSTSSGNSQTRFNCEGLPLSRWVMDPHQHVKIWFSELKTEFLDQENQLQLIRARAKNPTIKITFIYSGHCLDATALAELKKFCIKHHLESLDFDHDILTNVVSEEDKKLYAIAQEEINHCLTDKTGSMAAASDVARVITKIVEKGNYSDCGDVHIKTKATQLFNARGEKQFLPLNSPIVFRSFFKDNTLDNDMRKGFFQNADVIIAARDPENLHQLHPDALNALKKIQLRLIQKYESPDALRKEFLESTLRGLPNHLSPEIESPHVYYLFNKLFSENKSLTVFQLRQKIRSCTFMDLVMSYPLNKRKEIFGVEAYYANKEVEIKKAFLVFEMLQKIALKMLSIETFIYETEDYYSIG